MTVAQAGPVATAAIEAVPKGGAGDPTRITVPAGAFPPALTPAEAPPEEPPTEQGGESAEQPPGGGDGGAPPAEAPPAEPPPPAPGEKRLHPKRQAIIDLAMGEIGKVSDLGGEGGLKKGWERLKEYLDTALKKDSFALGWKDKIQRPGEKPCSWCGIFALWAVIKSGAAPNAQWVLGSPIQGLPAPKSGPGFAPGDIVVFREQVHHAIVKSIEGDALVTIDGNTMYQQIATKNRSASTVWYWYQTYPETYVNG